MIEAIMAEAQSISFRRGAEALAFQLVRIERRGNQSPTVADNESAGQIENRITVVGELDLDIEVGDRFNDGAGNLYKIQSVHPNRQILCQAVAVGIE